MERMEWLELLHQDSPLRKYIRWIDQNGNDALYRKQYEAIVQAQKQKPFCFLTVVIRTQGKRIEMLQDVFSCLQAQADPDFEVIVVCHRAEEKAIAAVRELIRAQTKQFTEKARLLICDYGQRGAPLNLGFASARGRYAVSLDDDDLVLDNWVKCFHAAEKESGREILHSWVLAQTWESRKNPEDGRQRLRASGAPDSKYCVPYNTLRQQAENFCPFMGLAFPIFLFRDFHILFDETLTTTEDWDYLLRTAGIAGVKDICEVTAIYRLWNTADVSRTQISELEWTDNYKYIIEKSDTPILITAKEAIESRSELLGLQLGTEKGRSAFLRQAVIFWSDGEPFSDRQHMVTSYSMKKEWIRAEFKLNEKCAGGVIRRLRVDPSNETLFCLEHVHIRLMEGERVIQELKVKDVRETNGFVDGDSILFLAPSPSIVMELKEPVKPCTVVFIAQVSYRSPEVICQWAEALCADARWLADNKKISHVYLDRGEGFSLSNSVACSDVFSEEHYQASFDISPEMAQGVKIVRFDPTETGMLWLKNLKIILHFTDGTDSILQLDQISWMNGFEAGDGLVFIERDPNLQFPVPDGKTLRRMTVTAIVEFLDIDRLEDLFAEARRVPDYKLICDQLNRARSN
ncbi:MAG: glycosyltransferase [Clostridia bacterium]|nr:glycosyltransferase [Clostridia bacterium]